MSGAMEDPEVRAIATAYDALRVLDPDACMRALRWLEARLNADHQASASAGQASPPG